MIYIKLNLYILVKNGLKKSNIINNKLLKNLNFEKN